MKDSTKYFDILRTIAVFAVISIHVSGGNMGLEGINRRYWNELNLYESFARFGVPLFVMISGALFLNTEKQIDEKYLVRKILRIVISFIVCSACYAFVFFRYDKTELVKNFIQGYGHLWFMFMIVGLYLVTPILRQVVKNRRVEAYFLLLAFIFAFLVNDLQMEIQTFLPSLAGNEFYQAFVFNYSRMYLYIPLGYTGYYVLGHYMHTCLRDIFLAHPQRTRLLSGLSYTCGGGNYNASDGTAL